MWYIYHCGEAGNRTYAQVYEVGIFMGPFPANAKYYGPYANKEEAAKAAEQRGLTLTSLQDASNTRSQD